MLRNGTRIGLNEVAVGLPVPHWLCDRMVEVVGHRNAERLLAVGATSTADDAVKLGLIDRAFDTRAEMDAAALESIAEVTRAPLQAQHRTLQFLRHNFHRSFLAERVLDVDQSWLTVSSPDFQKAVKDLQTKLAGKKKA